MPQHVEPGLTARPKALEEEIGTERKVTSMPAYHVFIRMKLCVLIAATLLEGHVAWAAGQPNQQPGPFEVGSLKLEWNDTRRGREVPAKIYFPKSSPSLCPVIVFSHGLGGTRDGYAYLGRHWASHGYASVHLQHHGSDDATWRGKVRTTEAMRAATLNVENSLNRPLDVTFALDQLTKLNSQAGPLKDRLNLDRVGVGGHSYGAFTALAIAGQRFGPAARSLGDSRVKAALAMSAPVPRRVSERSFDQIRIPMLHLTGTADESPINDTTASERRVPFDSIQHAPQWLITFEGGDHMIFGGRSPKLPAGRGTAIIEMVLQSTTTFWDAWLRDDAAAKRWLSEGGCQADLGKIGVLEKKQPEL